MKQREGKCLPQDHICKEKHYKGKEKLKQLVLRSLFFMRNLKPRDGK